MIRWDTTESTVIVPIIVITITTTISATGQTIAAPGVAMALTTGGGDHHGEGPRHP